MARVHGLSFADEKLITQITDVETLATRVPRLVDFWEGVKYLRELHRTDGVKGHLTKSTGWMTGRKMQYLGTIPVSVKAAIMEVDPDFFRSEEKVRRFFAAHPEYRITEIAK